MTLTLLLSLLVSLAALVWSAVLLRRLRDWRMAVLTLTVTLATLRQGLALWQFVGGDAPAPDPVGVLTGLLVSALILVLIVSLDRLLGDLRRYKLLSERTPDIIFQTDAAGRLTRLNDSFETLTGWPRRAWLNRSWVGLLNEDDRPRAEMVSQRLERGEEIVRLELRVATRWASWLWADFAITGELGDDGRFAGALAVARDITSLKHTEAALRRSDAQLRGLTDRLRRSRQDQESRIQRHLHDELGQLLSCLRIDLVWLTNRLAQAPAGAAERVASMLTLVDTSVQTMQRFAADLGPPWLEDMGLAGSIEAEAAVLEARSGCRCTLQLPPEVPSAERDRDRTVLQILREVFDNIARHAAARSVFVKLSCAEGALEVEVRDDGRGIAPQSIDSRRSLGLTEMRECARAAGGWLEISPLLQGGTVVQFVVPQQAPMQVRSGS